MEGNKELRKEGTDAFLTYLGVDNKIIEIWVKIISSNGFMIEFETDKNRIKIPYTRVIRIKERLE